MPRACLVASCLSISLNSTLRTHVEAICVQWAKLSDFKNKAVQWSHRSDPMLDLVASIVELPRLKMSFYTKRMPNRLQAEEGGPDALVSGSGEL